MIPFATFFPDVTMRLGGRALLANRRPTFPLPLPVESRFVVARDIPIAFETWAQSLISGRGPVLMVADSGGHLQELVWLDRIIPSSVPRIWVSSETEMSRSLLQDKDDVRLQTQRIYPRRFDIALRILPSVIRTLRETKPQAVISTGPAIAVPWLVVARLLRIPSAFIESATSVTRHGLTGILLEYVPGVYKFSQTGHCTKGWGTAPNVFDLIEAPTPTRPVASTPHVFVTVGSNCYPFDRLVRRLDTVLPRSWQITWQISGGDAAYRPTRGRVERFFPFSEMQRLFQSSDIVICHAGVGSTMSALEYGKRPIVVPRSARYGEHIDDHQHDLAQYLQRFPTIAVRTPDEISLDTLWP